MEVIANLIWLHLVELAIHSIFITVEHLILKYKGSRSETIYISSWIGESDPRSVYIRYVLFACLRSFCN